MQYSKIHQLEDIELSSRVVISDPCYTRDVWCRGELNITPGTYETKLFYSDEKKWGTRVAKLGVYRKGATPAIKEENSGVHVGVDSGQAGIFCDSIYPKDGKDSIGKYGDKNSFYGKVCDLTLGEGYENRNERYWKEDRLKDLLDRIQTNPNHVLIDSYKADALRIQKELEEFVDIPYWQGGTYEGKGLVSSSGYGDGGYDCIVGTCEDGSTAYLEIIFIDDVEEEESEALESEE